MAALCLFLVAKVVGSRNVLSSPSQVSVLSLGGISTKPTPRGSCANEEAPPLAPTVMPEVCGKVASSSSSFYCDRGPFL